MSQLQCHRDCASHRLDWSPRHLAKPGASPRGATLKPKSSGLFTGIAFLSTTSRSLVSARSQKLERSPACNAASPESALSFCIEHFFFIGILYSRWEPIPSCLPLYTANTTKVGLYAPIRMAIPYRYRSISSPPQRHSSHLPTLSSHLFVRSHQLALARVSACREQLR